MLPAIFPAYVTGAVTAAGGSWNAEHRRRDRPMGQHHADRDRHRRLYRRRPPRRATARGSRSASACCASTCWPSTGCCGGGSTISPPNGCGSIDEGLATDGDAMKRISAPHRIRRCSDRPSSLLRAAAVCKTYRTPGPSRPAGARPCRFRAARRRDRRDPRQVRLGQIDLSAHPRRADRRRATAIVDYRGQPVGRAGPRHRDGVSELSRCSRG